MICCPAGVNWLAVYVSNTAGSSDAGFDLDLQYAAATANTEVPAAITTAAASAASSTSIGVTWSKPDCDGSSFITSYKLTTSPSVVVSPVAVTNPFATTYNTTIMGLTCSTTYSFTLAAVNAAGTSAGKTVTASTSACAGQHRHLLAKQEA